MNWIERLYEIKGKDFYSQNGEGIYLEYIAHSLGLKLEESLMIDIGGGDGFYLSNSKFMSKLIAETVVLDKENGFLVTKENINSLSFFSINVPIEFLSIDIDGNDYWILQEILKKHSPSVIIAEFNPAFGDSRTIKYNPDHVWQGDNYYGFSFHAGVKLAEANRYKVIYQIADMNMIMVREDLIKVPIPPVTFKINNFFKDSERTDWEFV